MSGVGSLIQDMSGAHEKGQTRVWPWPILLLYEPFLATGPLAGFAAGRASFARCAVMKL